MTSTTTELVKMPNISNKLEIKMYLHCAKSLEEKPDDIAPVDWAKTKIGWTEQGIQLWCERHNTNVMHMDFEGQKHPANTDADYVGGKQ